MGQKIILECDVCGAEMKEGFRMYNEGGSLRIWAFGPTSEALGSVNFITCGTRCLHVAIDKKLESMTKKEVA
jgi:hypothetical protein